MCIVIIQLSPVNLSFVDLTFRPPGTKPRAQRKKVFFPFSYGLM